jgi:rhodanese-related sulfurtransferase
LFLKPEIFKEKTMKLKISLFIITLLFNASIWAATESPMTVAGAITVNAMEAKALFDSEALFVDVRKDSDWDAGRIPGAVHLDNNKGKFTDASLSAEIGKDDKVVIYCNGASCPRSARGAADAVSWGFKRVYYFRDGFPAWKGAGYPVE